MADPRQVTIYTDGAARGNPGPAGLGVVVLDERGKILSELARYIGETTNNQAEYHGLLAGLEEAARLGARGVRVRMDSELVVRQLSGTYRVKSPDLLPLFQRVRTWRARFQSFEVKHVSREENRRADALANAAIDEHQRR